MSAEHTTRRAILAGALSLPAATIRTRAAFAAPAKPGAEPYEPIWWEDPSDPIFALCGTHADAREAWEAEVHKNFALQLELPHEEQRSFITVREEHIVEDDDPRRIELVRAVDRTSNAMHDAAVAIAHTVPTSLSGVFCLARYYLEVAIVPGADYEGLWPDGLDHDYDPDLDKLTIGWPPMGYFVVRNIRSAVLNISHSSQADFRALATQVAAS